MTQRLRGFIRRPGPREVQDLAASASVFLTDRHAEEVAAAMDAMLGAIDAVDDLPPVAIPVKHTDRDPGRRPTPDEDPFNAIIRLCRVNGAPSGPLAGKSVGIKDAVKVAGIPMTNASTIHRGFVPTHDATVVERLLDAGAVVTAKTNLDDFSWAGTGETSTFGPTKNPRNDAYSPGGSSSGSAAAVAGGLVDLAIGADTAGSVRIPAAWCGIVGLKATHGLIPSFGAAYIDHTLDYLGPMAKSVEETALMLAAIAGDDPRDPQWVRGAIRTDDYARGLGEGVAGMRFGVVREALQWTEADPAMTAMFHDAVRKLEGLGAAVEEVSVPWWRHAWPIQIAIMCHSVSAMVDSNLEGFNRGGMCDPDYQAAFGKARRLAAHEVGPFLLVGILAGHYLRNDYFGAYYGKAQNLRHELRRQVDGALSGLDALITPVTAFFPTPLIDEEMTLTTMGEKGSANTHNTCALNLTGHPALSVPMGADARNLPGGLQIIAPHWREADLLRIAHAFEAG
ncbi:MAG: amidase [Dehalococcoidia bacterium]|nr:amidase [Dehalococcoidia bacterium]